MTEKPVSRQQYEVVCLTHGVIGVVAQAVLGLSLFNEHRLINEGCAGMYIQPQGVTQGVTNEEWKQVSTFGNGVIEARGDDRRIVSNDGSVFKYSVKRNL